MDVANVPENYHHLRTRYRLEQSRLIHWGDSVGLVEELLDRPSQVLRLNRNLIVDILCEMHALLMSCTETQERFDPLIGTRRTVPAVTAAIQAPKASTRAAIRGGVASLWRGSTQVVARVDWVMIRKDRFEDTLKRLIGYNDRMESFLDRHALHELQAAQGQSNLMLLQITEQVGELRSLVSALGLTRSRHGSLPTPEVHDVADMAVDAANFSALVSFKADHIEIDSAKVVDEHVLLSKADVSFLEFESQRQMVKYIDKYGWIEWRESIEGLAADSAVNEIVETRVKKLAKLLASSEKPQSFRAPDCLGCIRDDQEDGPRFGLLYDATGYAVEGSRDLLTLRQMIVSRPAPSLTKRLTLAKKLAESLFYLHAVNWLHKGFRSESIVFFPAQTGAVKSGSSHPDISEPIVSGFDFSRPDVAGEVTLREQSTIDHDLYRHPELLEYPRPRSRKDHDIYSLGLVLTEIALWSPIESIVAVERRQRFVPEIRKRILNADQVIHNKLLDRVGEKYAAAVRACVGGREEMDISFVGADKASEAQSNALLQEAYFQHVLKELQDLKV